MTSGNQSMANLAIDSMLCALTDSGEKRRGVRSRIFPQQYSDSGPCQEGGYRISRSDRFTTSTDAVWHWTTSTA